MNIFRKMQVTVLILAIMCCVGCGEKGKTSNDDVLKQEIVTESADSAAENSDKAESTDNNESESSNANESEDVKTMRVGAEKYGYIDVPEGWVPFTEEGHEDAGLFQYSDLMVNSIVTLNYFEDITAEQAMNNLYANMSEDETASDLNVSTVEIDGKEAYQILTHYTDDNTTFAVWLLDGDDGYMHYIAIEGNTPEVFNYYETYKVNE